MYEVEVKVRADHEAVRERLADLDADPLGTVEQIDTYFDAPHRDFAATDEALRLREERDADGAITELTYKGPLVEAESKTREEIESEVAHRDRVQAIFESLGFSPAATVEKERTRFQVDEFTVTLDSVVGVGEFVEVETECGREADVPAEREAAQDLLESLDLDPDDGIRTSYLGMLLADGDA
ncbi:class IV adenylate cyclase [Halorientalis pallida]|uniref:Class IV adenylate cyclase n=1 Tax=Halorientalis pallida TaxID=2479928 RepID=A0A498L3T3_9EURY|nr:class IV adenylate cyclase [Halorientalis pallida]RXK51284.1 class IV adenylate cyclase [Halorientalis pallida]